MNSLVSVSPEAERQLVQLMNQEGRDPSQTYIRVGVNSGGCSGLSYELGFSDELNEDDRVFEESGIRIAVNKKSLLYLAGTTLQFQGGLNGKGFSFVNPNATRTCGCGESFAV